MVEQYEFWASMQGGLRNRSSTDRLWQEGERLLLGARIEKRT